MEARIRTQGGIGLATERRAAASSRPTHMPHKFGSRRMPANGFIKLHRSILNHKLWTRGPFDAIHAWIDLLLLANFHDSKVLRGNIWVEVRRGQVFTSQVELAAKWRWDRKTVRSFLRALEADQMLLIQTAKQTDAGYTLLTIINYNKFQSSGKSQLPIDLPIDLPIQSPSNPHPIPIQSPLPKKDKKEPCSEECKETPKSPQGDLAMFAEFWDLYPRKIGKQSAVKAFSRIRANESLWTQIRDGLKARSEFWTVQATEMQYIPHPATWLNGRRWEDLIEPMNGNGNSSHKKSWSEMQDERLGLNDE